MAVENIYVVPDAPCIRATVKNILNIQNSVHENIISYSYNLAC